MHRAARLCFLNERQAQGLADRLDRTAQVAIETDPMPPPLVPFTKQLVDIAFDLHSQFGPARFGVVNVRHRFALMKAVIRCGPHG